MLEAALRRIWRCSSSAAPALDIIDLLTGAEAHGLVGATAFVEQHPSAQEVRVALNLEARGTSGPSQMFETGPGNAVLVREWAEVVPRPAGASLTYEVYKRMPNDTDFSAFRTLGIGGLNFAFIDDWEHYHTPLDSVASLDRRSLQHHGEAVLALARRLGDRDLMKLGERDAVYFSVPVAGVAFTYSSLWSLPLAAIALVAFVAVVVRARRRKEHPAGRPGARHRPAARLHRPGGVPRLPVRRSRGRDAHPLAGPRRRIDQRLVRRLAGRGGDRRVAGALRAPAAPVRRADPGAGGRLHPGRRVGRAGLVPRRRQLRDGVAGLGAARGHDAAASQAAGRGAATARAVLVCLLALPAVAILWPLVAAFFRTLGLAPMSAAAMGLGAALALGALAPQTEVLIEGRRWWPTGVAWTLALLLLLWGAASTRYSAGHPLAVNMTYVLDADARVAAWTTRSDRGIAWVEQFLGATPRAGRPAAFVPPWSSASAVPGFLTGDARPVDLPGPTAAVVRQVVTDGGRVLTIQLTPGAEGHALSAWLSGARVVQTAVEGRSVPAAWLDRPGEQAWSLDFINPPASGIFVVVDCKGSAPIRLAVLDRSAGLPDGAGRFAARPPELVPVHVGDQTVVRRTFTF